MLTTVTLFPAQDTTLYEAQLTTNANGAGSGMFVGNTNAQESRRALLKFDLTQQIPPGSAINEVSLQVTVTKTQNDLQTVSLHTLLADWGEGNSNANDIQGGGKGAPVSEDSATWQHRRYSDQLWSTPGGDFDPDPSASNSVGGNGTYIWQSNTMIDEVQAWLEDPVNNYGWILIGNEVGRQTTKRFGTRESGARPVLTVDFDAPDLPLVSIAGTSAIEGDVNLNSFDFPVTLSRETTQPITISYQTKSDTATADEDFDPTSGQIVFNPGDPLTQNISVFVKGDLANEDDEQFLVEITQIDGLAEVLGPREVAGTIENDDPLPTIDVEDVSMDEGNEGFTQLELTITLSEASGREVTVQFATENETAEADVDYLPASGQVTFDPGDTSKTLTLQLNGDVEIEEDETFNVVLTTPVNAELGVSSALVTIQNDDFPAANPWQNKIRPEDVDNDGFVVPLDALLVINDLNRFGARALPVPPVEPDLPPPFLDVDGDDFVAPLDALRIINYLNNPPLAAVAGRSVATSAPFPSTAAADKSILPEHAAAALADTTWFDSLSVIAARQRKLRSSAGI